MCMTRQSVLCMNTNAHPQRKKIKNKKKIFLPLQYFAREQRKTCTAYPGSQKPQINREPWKQFLKDFYTSCLSHCYEQVNLYNSESFFSLFEIKERGWADLKIQAVLVTTDNSSVAQLTELLYGTFLQQAHTNKSLSTQPVRLQEPSAQTVVFGIWIHLKLI